MRWWRASPVLLAMGLLACSDPSGTGDDVHVDVRVDRTVLSQTDTTDVRVIVTNVSMRKVTIYWGGCTTLYEVVDPRGNVTNPGTSGFCLAYLEFAELNPGESHSVNYTWRPLVSSSEPLTPGTYRIRGLALTEDGRYRSKPVGVIVY